MITYLSIVLIVIIITIITILLIKVNNHSDNKEGQPKGKIQFKNHYITPGEFKVGLLPPEPYKSSNLCNDKVLFPVKPLNVQYGGNNCDGALCTQYIQAP